MDRKNTLVKYEGGGYDGCIWEYNYCYFDQNGTFHNMASTGVFGCPTLEKLDQEYAKRPKEFQFFEVPGGMKDLGEITAVSHMLGIAKWFVDHDIEMNIPVTCDECGKVFNLCDGGEGTGLHGCGGIAMDYDNIICSECESSGTCAYCGEFVGNDECAENGGYCVYCRQQHPDF